MVERRSMPHVFSQVIYEAHKKVVKHAAAFRCIYMQMIMV